LPDQDAAGLEVALGAVKKAMAFAGEFARSLQLSAELDHSHCGFRGCHDGLLCLPAPINAPAVKSFA
jgi:hypothetical protein